MSSYDYGTVLGYVGLQEYLDNVWGCWLRGSLRESFTTTHELGSFEKTATEYFIDRSEYGDQPWTPDASLELAVEFWESMGALPNG